LQPGRASAECQQSHPAFAPTARSDTPYSDPKIDPSFGGIFYLRRFGERNLP
jgi:hypothetical protein